MAWLEQVFVYGHPDSLLFPAVMWSTSLLSAALTLVLRKLPWTATAFWAAFTLFLFFSVTLTLFNGVRSTAAIGGMFMIAYVVIAAFPTAAAVRLILSVFRRLPRKSRSRD